MDERGRTFAEAVDAAAVGLWVWHIQDDRIEWSDTLIELFGRTASPASNREYRSWVHPAHRDRVRDAFARCLADPENATDIFLEYRIEHPDGIVRWVEGRGQVVLDAAGQPLRMAGTTVDCTRRKQAEEQLREREATFRLYTELASDYIYIVDVQGGNLAPRVVAGSFERTTGMTLEQVEERGGWVACIHPDDQAGSQEVLGAFFRGEAVLVEYRIVTPEGQVRWLRDRGRPLLDDGGQLVRIQGAVQDITESKRLEEQLLAAQKHEALARLSGGVAHDFNNLLTVILGSASLLAEDATDPASAEVAQAILTSVDHATALTRGLLLFAGRSLAEPSVVEVGRLLDGATPVLLRALGQRRLEVIQPVDRVHVRIDRSEAQLMLLNLIVNARHASASGSRVRIVASLQEGEDLPVELDSGPHVAIAVQDEGVGIERSILARVFEPYFTTRRQGEGTGLGLAACQGIATRAGGAIRVESEPGMGSTFTVYLPVVAAPTSRRTAQKGRMHVARGGTERVLVVDDEPMLRRLFELGLVRLGYAVQVAANAEEAVERLEQGTFDLVVSDVVMPGEGGVFLARTIDERWPGTPVLLMSGNADIAHHPWPFLAKPVSPSELAAQVRRLLDG